MKKSKQRSKKVKGRVKMAPKPWKVFRYPLVKAPKAGSELKRRGKTTVGQNFVLILETILEFKKWKDRKLKWLIQIRKRKLSKEAALGWKNYLCASFWVCQSIGNWIVVIKAKSVDI